MWLQKKMRDRVNASGLAGARRGSYFDEEPESRNEIKVIMKKAKKVKAASKNEVKWEILKREGELAIDWVFWNYLFYFEIVVPEDEERLL